MSLLLSYSEKENDVDRQLYYSINSESYHKLYDLIINQNSEQVCIDNFSIYLNIKKFNECILNLFKLGDRDLLLKFFNEIIRTRKISYKKAKILMRTGESPTDCAAASSSRTARHARPKGEFLMQKRNKRQKSVMQTKKPVPQMGGIPTRLCPALPSESPRPPRYGMLISKLLIISPKARVDRVMCSFFSFAAGSPARSPMMPPESPPISTQRNMREKGATDEMSVIEHRAEA
jgi:hypothetical protein